MNPNIDRRGRIARAITGSLCIVLAISILLTNWPHSPGWRWSAILALVLSGVFQIYEAKKSWCIARACGLKTPM